MLAGFLIPNALLLGWLVSQHAFPAYIESVWRWGLLYAGAPPGDSPVENALIRLANWFGFHAALGLAAGLVFRTRAKDDRARARLLRGRRSRLPPPVWAGDSRRTISTSCCRRLAIAGARGVCLLTGETRDIAAPNRGRCSGGGRSGRDHPLRPPLFPSRRRRPRRPASCLARRGPGSGKPPGGCAGSQRWPSQATPSLSGAIVRTWSFIRACRWPRACGNRNL